MSSNGAPLSYVGDLGFQSVAAPAIFLACYTPLLGVFLWRSFKMPTHVYYVLAFFCAIRIAAFGIRTALTASSTGAQNLNLIITDETLFGVGFFGLLYSAYNLVLDLEALSDRPESKIRLIRITQNRRMFRLLLLSAVVIGAVGSSIANGSFTNSTANALRKTSVIIFLVLTILQAFQTVYYAWMELRGSWFAGLRYFLEFERFNFDMVDPQRYMDIDEPLGKRHAIFILVAISLLLLVREIFLTATINNPRKQIQESLWYPLVALPEILAVILYAIPGLVPSRKELPRY
ncbi:hypothetical protein NLJ89_g11327 [Agrocybe chaxingu]|uniref:Uncharacterized protein n=1 Tax=Agrocybe chaxingu TaxID=84603 RepID=A0A9W8JNY0_9AGAR|nr:hypothetical protein NLJ89_g11327 [Agrocybe chaxingu]